MPAAALLRRLTSRAATSAMSATPTTTPTTVPAMAPPLMPLPLLLPLEADCVLELPYCEEELLLGLAAVGSITVAMALLSVGRLVLSRYSVGVMLPSTRSITMGATCSSKQ